MATTAESVKHDSKIRFLGGRFFGQEAFIEDLEVIIPFTFAGASSGGNTSYYTDSTSWVNINDGEFVFDPDDYPDAKFYLEVVGRAGAYGEATRKLSVRLYNLTTGSGVDSSLAETTQTSESDPDGPGAWVKFRSGEISFPSGDNEYIAQYKSDTAGLFVDVMRISIVVAYEI